MALREEVLRRNEGHNFEEPDGEFLTLVESRTDRLVVLTRVEESDAQSSGDDAESDYPTNDDGEPLCVGKDSGQCSRVVDEPGAVCWQHDD